MNLRTWLLIFTFFMFIGALMMLLNLLIDAAGANNVRFVRWFEADYDNEYKSYGLTQSDWAAFESIKQTKRYQSYADDASVPLILGTEAMMQGDKEAAERYAQILVFYDRQRMRAILAFQALKQQWHHRLPLINLDDELIAVISLDCQGCDVYRDAITYQRSADVPLKFVVLSESKTDIQAWATANKLVQTDQIHLYMQSELPHGFLAEQALYQVNSKKELTCLVGSC